MHAAALRRLAQLAWLATYDADRMSARDQRGWQGLDPADQARGVAIVDRMYRLHGSGDGSGR
jgi:hypothetical protein